MKNKIYTKAYVLELKKKQSSNINTCDRSLYQQRSFASCASLWVLCSGRTNLCRDSMFCTAIPPVP